MTTQSLEFGYTTGQSLTAKAFAIGSDTVSATADSVTERTNAEGRYLAAFTDLPSGNYLLVYFLDDDGAGSEKYVTDGTTATFQPESELLAADIANSVRSEMDASSTQLAAIVADTNELQTDWADGGRLDVLLDASGTVVLPTSATVPSRGDETSVSLYLGETIATSFTITDASGDPVDLSGRTLELAVETLTGTDVATIEDGSITVSGGSNQTATVTWPSAVTDSVRSLRMFLRDTDNGEVLIDGKIHVDYSAESD